MLKEPLCSNCYTHVGDGVHFFVFCNSMLDHFLAMCPKLRHHDHADRGYSLQHYSI